MPCDYKNYPANWKTEIRPAILKRAKDKCEFCKLQNYSLVHPKTRELMPDYGRWMMAGAPKLVKIILTIAHLDHDLSNNNYDNLKALCQKCHLNYDKVHHANNSRNTRNKKKKQISLF